MEGGRASTALILTSMLLIVSISFLQADGQEAEQNTTRAPGDALYPEPEIDIVFDHEKFESDPHPSEGGDVYLTGELICIVPQSVPLGVICTVTLKTQSEEAHDNDLRKYDFNRDLDKRNFSLFMRVFLDIKGDTDIPVDVIATWEYANTAQASSKPTYYRATIYVPPYGTLELSTPFHYGDIMFQTGEWFEITLEIENQGNVNINVELVITKKPENMEAVIDESSFSLNSHQSKIVYLRIKQTSGAGQRSTLTIRANSNMPVSEPGDHLEISLLSEEKVEVNAPAISIIFATAFFIVFIGMMIVFIVILISRRRKVNQAVEEEANIQDQYGHLGP